jgi:hypothetical protein
VDGGVVLFRRRLAGAHPDAPYRRPRQTDPWSRHTLGSPLRALPSTARRTPTHPRSRGHPRWSARRSRSSSREWSALPNRPCHRARTRSHDPQSRRRGLSSSHLRR